MAKAIICSGGGGGSGSDDCTATRSRVLEGYTAITQDSDDEPAEGTIESMAGRTVTPGLSSQTVSCNGKYMTGNIIVNAIPNQRGYAQYAGGWRSSGDYYAMNQIPVGYYTNTSDNEDWAPEIRMAKTTVRSVLGVSADKIRRGDHIADVEGTFEGYTLTGGYIYRLGNNDAGFALGAGFGVTTVYGTVVNEPGGAYFRRTSGLNIRMWISGSQVNLTGVSTIRLKLRLIDGNSAEAFNVQLYYGSNKNTTQEGIVKVNTTMKWSEFNVDIDVSSISGNKYLGFYFGDLSETNVFSVHGVQLL